MQSFLIRNKVNIGLFAATMGICAVIVDRKQTREVFPNLHPDGAPKTPATKMLDFGAKILQSHEPMKTFNIYFVGFHPMKNEPCHQMEAHHYCKQVNEDFAQCLIFDGNTANANLTGVEYIISEQLYRDLPLGEHQFWHPHNYEILSGQLQAKGLPAFAEKQLMKSKLNSYGKTIHTWRAKCWEGDKPFQDSMPLGSPLLGWSLNHDGEAKHGIVESRDLEMETDTEHKKRERADLVCDARPQGGVNALLSRFQQKEGVEKIKAIAGVTDIEDTTAVERAKTEK